MNTELLNKVQQLIIDQANANGTDLQQEFGTIENFKRFVIAFAIKSCTEHLGMSIRDAFDFAMGDGEYKKLADSCWSRLQNA